MFRTRPMARLGAAAPLLLLLARARADEGSKKTYGMTPHEVATLDWTLAPFKGLISKYLVNIFPNAPSHTAEEVKRDFINYTRMFHSDDFPRDLTRPYAGIPLFIYVSVLILVAWIIISIFFCCFRCCCRKTKCCTPVLYGPRKNRRKNERKCCVVYFIGLLLFITTTVLHVVVILLIPKLGKQATNDVIEPLYVYAKVLPGKLGKIPSELPESIGTIVRTILEGIILAPLGTRLGNMADFQLAPLETLIVKLAEYLQGKLMDDTDELKTLFDEAVTSLDNMDFDDLKDYLGDGFGDVNNIKTMINDFKTNIEQFTTYIDIDKLLGMLNDKIRDFIKDQMGSGGSDDEGNNDEGNEGESTGLDLVKLLKLEKEEGPLATLTTCMGSLVKGKMKDSDLTEGKEGVFECILKDIDKFLDMKVLEQYIQDTTKDALTGLNSITDVANTIQSYLVEYKEVITIVLKIIKGESDDILADVAKIFEEFSGSEEGDESGQSFEDMIDQLPSGLPKVVRTAGKALKYTKWIVLGSFVLVMVLFYILPVSMALCLRKRNRREGKCQCKCWIKCSTCFCTAWLPTVFIFASIFGFIGVFLYLTMVGLILNTDKSNFEDKNVDGKIIPAPMGKAFVDRATNGYIEKKNLIKQFVNPDSLEMEGALGKIVRDLIKELEDYVGDLIPGLLLCKDSGVKETSTEVADSTEDEDQIKDSKMIDKYGTFLTALQLDRILDTLVDVLRVDTLGKLLDELLGGMAEGSENSDDKKEEEYDPLLYFISSMLSDNIDIPNILDSIENALDDLGLPTEEQLDNASADIKSMSGIVSNLYSIVRTGEAGKNGNGKFTFTIPKEMKIKVGDQEEEFGKLLCDPANSWQGSDSSAVSSMQADIGIIKGKCTDNGSLSDVSIEISHNFFDVMEAVHNSFTEDDKNDDRYKFSYNLIHGFVSLVTPNLRTSITNLNNALQIIIEAIEKIGVIIKSLISEIKEEIQVAKAEKQRTYKNYHEEKIENNNTEYCPNENYSNCWVGIAALYGTLESSVGGLVSALRGLDKHEFLSGMLSCYPVAVMTEGVVGMANSVSVLYTLDELALFILAVGCLIMMVAANMGPIVYHVRYKYKCCCCCHKKGWETDPDNGGSRGRQNNRRRDPEVVRRSMNNNNMVVQPSNINIYDQSSAYQPSQQSVTVSFSVAGNAQSQQQYMYGSESNMPHRNNGYYNSQAQSSARNSHYSSRPMYSDRDYYSNIDGSSMIVK